MAKQLTQRGDLLPSKDVVLTEVGHDGEEHDIKFKIYKMPATEAEVWLGEVIALALRCGIPIPRGIDKAETGFDAVMMEWAGNLASGNTILQLKDLNFNEVQRILNMLFKYVMICLVDPATGETVNMLNATPQNINDHVASFKTIFKLRMEVIGFSYGFFESVDSLVSKIQKLQSNLRATRTSAPSSAQLLADGEPSN